MGDRRREDAKESQAHVGRAESSSPAHKHEDAPGYVTGKLSRLTVKNRADWRKKSIEPSKVKAVESAFKLELSHKRSVDPRSSRLYSGDMTKEPTADFFKTFAILCDISIEEAEQIVSTLQNREKPSVQAMPRLKWEANRKDGETPAHFAARAYAAEMAAGTLHRGVIAKHDPALHRKLSSWLRSHPMPDGIDIPTMPEWNTRQLKMLGKSPSSARPVTEEARLHSVLRHRTARAANSPRHM